MDEGHLREEFAARGVRADFARSLPDLRSAFFARGGHDLLVLLDDVAVCLAERAVTCLRDLDPTIGVVAFGRELARCNLQDPVSRLVEYHPASRAGVGAILRVLATRSP